MKLFILISIIFVFHQQGFTLKSKIKLDSNIDPFQFLGISDFKKDLSEYVPKKRLDSQSHISSYNSNSRAPSIRLNSISDLPKLFESGDFNNIEGFKSMTRFLTEDDERLFDNGGIFDESGFDGVDQEASELYSKGSISREKERAKSASIIWLRKTDPMSKLEPYSCTLKQDEDLVEWAVYEVVMMCCSGNMEIKRVCISKNEELAMISFVLNSDDKCENRVGIAQEFIGKGLKYLKRIGMKNLADDYESKMKESFIKLVKDRKQEKDKQFSKELKNKKKNKNDTISNITQKKSGHEVEKINEAFEFKEKNLSKIETKHRESEGKTVIELKQEVNSLKDDLKDLKELLKQNLISQTSSKEITEKNLIGKNEKEPKNSLEIKNENITKNSEITVNEYPEP